jgi:TRAP-type mannitol/chloroaromatic compound transport system substrate-binding protein
VPQTLAGGDIYPALERGTIDAAEWVGPYDDERLGFHKIAKNYYYPGWWEGSAGLQFYVNLKSWNDLPEPYRVAFESAAAEANVTMQAEYDARNAPALARLVGQGVKLHAYPRDVMIAAQKFAQQMYEEEATKNPAFKKIYVEWKKFAHMTQQWFKVAEASYANFLFSGK